jgi:peptide/nickel transport system ATP-binding protein
LANGPVPVLEHLSFDVAQGKTMALVGESGCGKSMTALAIMRLLPEDFAVTSGRILLDGEDVLAAAPAQLRGLRGNKMSMIFQEPMTALNPLYTVGDQIGEVLRQHRGLGRSDATEQVISFLKAVQIPAAEQRVNAYPHQLSGGMRQRVMIAMALACKPKLLIADEPTTALDVTVQAQIFDLLSQLQDDTDTAILLITHDLGAVAELADEPLHREGIVARGDRPCATSLYARPDGLGATSASRPGPRERAGRSGRNSRHGATARRPWPRLRLSAALRLRHRHLPLPTATCVRRR